MKPKFGIKDSWFRYEFQGRGSTHVHGFAWIDPAVAPALSANIDTEAGRHEFTQFWSHHVYAVNPDLDRQPPARRSRGVYNMSPNELENKKGQLSDVINRTQIHACSDAYCIRKRKRVEGQADTTDLPRVCRFHFPRPTGPANTSKV
jgi:ATP-dependent DNA helicase PIF1